MRDPGDVVEELPERPLKPKEVEDIADKFEWSCFPITFQTENGSPYVPMWFAFQPVERKTALDEIPVGRVIDFHMDGDMSDWNAEIIFEEKTLLEVADAINHLETYPLLEVSGMEIIYEQDGEEKRRSLDSDDE